MHRLTKVDHVNKVSLGGKKSVQTMIHVLVKSEIFHSPTELDIALCKIGQLFQDLEVETLGLMDLIV